MLRCSSAKYSQGRDREVGCCSQDESRQLAMAHRVHMLVKTIQVLAALRSIPASLRAQLTTTFQAKIALLDTMGG